MNLSCRSPFLVFRCSFLLLLLASLSVAHGAGVPQYKCRVWQVEDGLPQNIVQAVVQTRDGYLWVGTQRGLARFDGVRFTIFDKVSAPQLSAEFISSLFEGHDGSLWIGTTRGGIMQYKDGKFSTYSQTNGLSTNYVKVVLESKDGTVWIGTVSGLSKFKDGHFDNAPFGTNWTFGAVRALEEDEHTNLWVGTDQRLLQVTNNQMIRCTDTNGYFTRAVRALHCDHHGNLWIGTQNGGVVRYNQKEGPPKLFTTEQGLLDNMITAIYADSSENLWVGTYAGLCRLTDGRFVRELNYEKLSFDMVNAFCEDREGNLWIGSKDGLNQLTRRAFTTYSESEGLTRNNVLSICEGRDNTLWIGTWGGGVNYLRDGKISALVSTNAQFQHQMSLVLSLHESRDGSLWIGTDFVGGLFRYKDGVFTRYWRAEGLSDGALRVIHEDRAGNLWIGSSTALVLYRDGKFKRFTTKDGLAGNVVRAIYETRKGELLFGTDGGLSRWEKGRFKNFTTRDGLSVNMVVSIYEDSGGDIWIGTQGGGLNRMLPPDNSKSDGSKPRFSSYTTRQGLFNDDVFEILEGNRSRLWMSCRYGIFCVDKKQFDDLDHNRIKFVQSISYGRPDGLISTECNSIGKPAACKTKDGRLWFGTAKGLGVIDPTSEVDLNTVVPPVMIERVIADRKPVFAAGRQPATLTIPPGRGELEFHYTGLSFAHPEKNRFKYKLNGVDPDWVDAGARRAAFYNNINPGTYRFQVIACNDDALWNETGAAVDLVILPHFWETWWFSFLFVIVSIGGVATVARYLTQRRLRRTLQRLEHQHALDKERARIAKDMHDHLGASLTRLGLLSELARRDAAKPEMVSVHTEKICAMTHDVAETLDEIVWSVNPENDTLKRLVSYIVHYTEELFETANIRCRMDIPTTLPDCILSADLRHNLYSAIKEACNNVVKHSGATEVRLHLAIRGRDIEVSIEDNGKGFDVEKADDTRNGLKNLRKRLQDVHGCCEISSEPGKGARVFFKCHVPNLKEDHRFLASDI